MTYYNFMKQQKMWYQESHKEKGLDVKGINEDYSIYPKRIYKNINLGNPKIYDFVFLGSYKFDKETILNRKWIIPFIDKNFNDSSYLQFTDHKTKEKYLPLGSFDYTLKKNGLVPKEMQENKRDIFDKNYYDIMSKSKFCLCPAGDSMWSMRFYDAIMSKSIPIVNHYDEIYRSLAESKLDYKYYLVSDNKFVYREDWVNHNYEILLKYHTLEYL